MNVRDHDSTPDLYAAHVSGGKWKPYRHLSHLADEITEAVMVGEGRLVGNFHPGVGKSEFMSKWVPIWFLDNFPERNIGLLSYQSDIAVNYGRKVRNEVNENQRCRVKLSDDSKAAGRFHTDRGGGVFCAGVDTALLGFRLHLAVFDDPYKGWSEAWNPDVRAKTMEWFMAVVESRMEPGGTIIVDGQRFHPDDIHGELERTGQWKVVRMPAVAEAGDPLGRQPGEALCPERFDVAALDRIKGRIGQLRWDAMYQQAPTGAGTGRLYSRYSARNRDDTLKLDPAHPLHLSVDFNINPGMHMEIGQHRELDGTFIVTDEIYRDALDLVGALDMFEKWVSLNGRNARGGFKFPEVHVFGDSAGLARQIAVTRSCYDMIAGKLSAMKIPYRIRVPRQAPPVRDSIDALNDALLGMDGVPRFFVHPRCVRLIADFEQLNRSVDGLIDKRNQKLSHAADAERYRLAMLKPAGRDMLPERPKGRIFIANGVY